MSERFGQQALRPAANLEINSMSQRVNETHEHWGDRVMTMAQQAFGSSTTLEVLHEQMVMRFALGCRDTEAGRYLLNVPPRTLEDAIKVVKTFEMSKSATGNNSLVSQVRERSPTRDARSPSRCDSSRDEIKQLLSEVRDALAKCIRPMRDPGESDRGGRGCSPRRKTPPRRGDNRGPSKSDGKGNKEHKNGSREDEKQTVCYTCNRKGHMSYDCPDKRQRSPSPYPRPTRSGSGSWSRTPTPTRDRGRNVHFNERESQVRSIVISKVMSRGKAWLVPVKINGFEINAIVDTAAEVTLISNRLYKSLTPRPDVKRKLRFKTADGKSMSAEMLEPLTLEVGKLRVEHEVLKSDLSDEMLLGMDFLFEANASLECGQGILTIGGQRIPL